MRPRILHLLTLTALAACAGPGRGPHVGPQVGAGPQDRSAGRPMAVREANASTVTTGDRHATLAQTSRLWYRDGRHGDAIEMLEEARAREGELPEPLRLGLALHYEAVGRWDESAELFATTSQRPSSAVLFHLPPPKSLRQAGADAEAAVRENPESAVNQNYLGLTRLYAGDPERARDAFLRALELDPDLIGALYNLAIVETFYFFDEAAGRDWFQLYRERGAMSDPGGLGATFADGAANAGDVVPRR